jgi:hypothetical protein
MPQDLLLVSQDKARLYWLPGTIVSRVCCVSALVQVPHLSLVSCFAGCC